MKTGYMHVASPRSDKAASAALEIRRLESGAESDWDRFILGSQFGTFFHLSGWMRVVEQVFGYRPILVVARRDGQITGVLPASHVRNRLFGNCLISSPLAVYGGICANDSESYLALLGEGCAIANDLRVKYLELRNPVEPFQVSLPGRDLYVSFTMNLSRSPEAILQKLPRDTRYAIRKSQKAGLDWTEDITDAEFYEIYAHSVHRLGTPVFPATLFQAFRREFPRQSRIFGVRKSGKAIAAVMCFYFRRTVLPYYAGALEGYQKDSPNNFMYWSLIEQSCREGLETFDFGRSKRGTGSYRFKSAWSMIETPLPYRYQLVRATEIPHLSPIDKQFQLATAAWTKLPYAWSKILGPHVIRWIPSI